MPEREERVRFAAFLNFAFTIVEIIGGFWTNSLAILSDALHDFGDSIALLVSWLFERGAKKSPDARYTFGYQRLSLFSALFSASILIGGSIVIIFQAIPRFFNPVPVNAFGMVGIAFVGNCIQWCRLLSTKKGRKPKRKNSFMAPFRRWVRMGWHSYWRHNHLLLEILFGRPNNNRWFNSFHSLQRNQKLERSNKHPPPRSAKTHQP